MSNNKFSSEISLEERQKKFLEMSDEDIDYSEIPALDDEFFKNAKLVKGSPHAE